MGSAEEDAFCQPEKGQTSILDEADSDDDWSEEKVPFKLQIDPVILEQIKHLDLHGKLEVLYGKVIGRGAFSDAFRAKVRQTKGGKPIRACAKRLRLDEGEDWKRLIEAEVYVWHKLKNHPNILPLLGYAFDDPTGYPFLVSRWMKNGSALKYVKDNLGQLTQTSIGIARGLSFLHENDVIHSDLKPDNVLISDEGEAVLCDFGQTRFIQATKSLGRLQTGVAGTADYLAFELVTVPPRVAKHSKESDVWAFGVTVFELLIGDRAYGNATEAQVAAAIQRKELPSLPETLTNPVPPDVKDELWYICRKCWDFNPETRVKIDGVLRFLESSNTPSP